MKVSVMINHLKRLQDKYGDLPIVGGYINDDSPPNDVFAIDEDGCKTLSKAKAIGFFMEA